MRKNAAKKWIWLLAFGILVSIGIYAFLIQGSIVLNCRTWSEEKICTVQPLSEVEKTESISLLWNGHELPRDKESGVFCLPQTLQEEWEGSLDARMNGLPIPIRLDREDWQDKRQAIRQERKMAAYVEVGKEWRKLEISATGLPVMEIFTERQAPQPGEEAYGSMSLFWPEAKTRQEQFINTALSYHIRGYGSMAFEKKNYKLTLLDQIGQQKNLPLLGLRDDDDWRLYSLASDETLCKEKAVCDLWNQWAKQTGQPSTNELLYFELYLDGSYRGVYAIGAPLDQKTYNLSQEDRLYKQAKIADIWVPWVLNILDGQQITNWDDRLMVEWPKNYEEGIWTPLNSYVSQLWWKNGEESSMDLVRQIADMDNLMDVALYKQWIYALDGMDSNQLYIWKAADGKVRRVLYDTDTVLGADSRAYGYRNAEEMAKHLLSEKELSALCYMDPEGTAALAAERWALMSEEIFQTEYLISLLDENQQYLEETGGLARNGQKWKDTRASTDGTRESISMEDTKWLIGQRSELMETWIAEGLRMPE